MAQTRRPRKPVPGNTFVAGGVLGIAGDRGNLGALIGKIVTAAASEHSRQAWLLPGTGSPVAAAVKVALAHVRA